MKKLLFVALAAVGMTACVQNEELAVSKGNAIAFANDFIDNATKSIDGTYQNNGTGANELTKFHVYGTVENGNGLANIFNEELVSKQTSGAWTYDVNKTQYWVSGNTYNFAAVANAEAVVDVEQGVDGMPTAIKYDATQAANGTQHDLLYAEKKGIDYQSGDATTVKFTFAHLLAKAKFTVKNQMQNGNGNYYTVEDVKILDAVKTATYEVGGTWVAHAGQHNVTFGHVAAETEQNPSVAAIKLYENGVGASNYERLLVPQENATLKIQFGLKYYVQDKVNNSEVLNHSETKSVDATVTLEAGRAYNFIITLGNPGEPITFDVETINEWVEKDVAVNPVSVTSAAELSTALAEGKNVVLAQDITVNAPIVVAEGQDVIVDLGGKKLTLAAAQSGVSELVNEGTMELKNGTISSLNSENCRRCVYNYGTMTIDGVTFKQVYSKKGAAINNEGNLTIENATVDAVFYSVYTSGANAVTTINGGTYKTTNDVNDRENWAYGLVARAGSKLIINGGSFTGNHGVVAAEGGSTATLNAGTFNCTATYTGNSDWTLYTDANSAISYNAEACTVTSANPSGATYGNVTTF